MKEKRPSPFRQTLNEVYDFIGDIPIYGGWGYKRDDAIIIDKYDTIVDTNQPFNGIGLEYFLTRYRNYLELITFNRNTNKCSEIEFYMDSQETQFHEDCIYDHIVYTVAFFLDSDYVLLKDEWESGYGRKDFDLQAHRLKRSRLRKYLTREVWFEIGSFFGEETLYRWNFYDGPFFLRKDGTKCPIEVPMADITTRIFRRQITYGSM